MAEQSKITYRQWRTNLWLYIIGAVAAYIASTVTTVNFEDMRQVVAFLAGTVAAGIIPAKAYTGRASDVEAPVKETTETTESTGPR